MINGMNSIVTLLTLGILAIVLSLPLAQTEFGRWNGYYILLMPLVSIAFGILSAFLIYFLRHMKIINNLTVLNSFLPGSYFGCVLHSSTMIISSPLK